MLPSRIESILASVRELSSPIRAHGASIPTAALLLSRWLRDAATPLVIYVPDDDAARTLAQDVGTLSRTLHSQEAEVLIFPTWEQSPYSPISPSIRIRLERMATLNRLAEATLPGQPGRPLLLITSIAAAAQATLPRSALHEHGLFLTVGSSVESRESLIRALLDAGYLRTDSVEDPATFSVRGEIVDLFPPEAPRPYRIELFGDEVERIREFDAATQRTLDPGPQPLQTLRLGPAREVLIHSRSLPRLRERLKTWADEAGVPRQIRDPLLEALDSGAYPDHSDCWAPFAWETPGRLENHLQPSWPRIVLDELSCSQVWDEFRAEQKDAVQEMARSGVIAPPFEALFSWGDEKEAQFRSGMTLYLDRLETADLSTHENETAPTEFEAPQKPEERGVRLAERHRIAAKLNPSGSAERLDGNLRGWLDQRFKILILASTVTRLERIRFLLGEREIPTGPLDSAAATLQVGSLSQGFRWPSEGWVVLTDGDLLGQKASGKNKKPKSESGSAAQDWAGLQALSDLNPGDRVVHVDHGIGCYLGLARLSLQGAPADFLLIEYAGKDKLYLPVYRLNVIQKYSGAGEAVPLDKLGGAQFQKAKEKVRESAKRLAIDLVKLYAERKIRNGVIFPGRDPALDEFEARFPFEETPDQLRAIDQVLDDLSSGRVMDRLVCGDVGYGKTEVAMRAAFRVASEGKQVAVLVPTTVLAHQHEQNFRQRMKDTPFVIESASRFKSAREQKKTLEKAAQGKVDILVGTHRLLSRDVKFKDLSLVIVDEEQRFGVEHKERLKTLKLDTHVLTLTATPIPRTLHMALSGLRDISLINTPPVDRLPIRTYVSRFEESLIQRAIEAELKRGGQVFFVHNRVQTIGEMARKIEELVPQARVGVGHGQMAEGALEEVMVAFYEKRINVLVCTTIIESGIDLPSANTLIVNRADTFGLSQLYQIRGRVGRGQARAYAYLLLPAEGSVTEDAKKRLEVIQRFVELGSGFSIASHDLELRGGGDLLGASQSGHIEAVGFELYMDLLNEAILEIQSTGGPKQETAREPEIKVSFPAYLPETYIPDVHQRLSMYRRFSSAPEEAEVDRLEEELQDRFGPPPLEAQELLWLIRIKLQLKRARVDALTAGPEKVVLTPGEGSRLDPSRAIALMSSQPKRYQLTPDSRFIVTLPTRSLRDLCLGLESLLKDLLPRTV